MVQSLFNSPIGFLLDYIYSQYTHRNAIELAAKVLSVGPVPKHIAFCMDGNRRYAKQNNLDIGGGHIAGLATLVNLLNACQQLGIHTVTAYAFSLENFHRPVNESQVLFNLIRNNLWDIVEGQESQVKESRWRIRFLGNRSRLENDIVERIEKIEQLTDDCTGMTVNICCPYTSRDDIAHAIDSSVKATYQANTELDTKDVYDALYLSHSEPLDLLVRTSGETRLSDFMCWEVTGHRCDIVFTKTLWPDFSVLHLYRIILKWGFRRTTVPLSMQPLSELPPAPPMVSVGDRKAVNRPKGGR